MTKLSASKRRLLELMQKHIRQRDLLGIVEHLTLLLSGYANDRQLKTLFNYLLQTGNARRFGRFIHEVGRRQGKREGRLEGVEEGPRAEALRIAQTMLAEGMALETVLRITGLSEADIGPLFTGSLITPFISERFMPIARSVSFLENSVSLSLPASLSHLDYP
jgi:predicted transposase/invertase (TIGR01784 family)